MKPKLLFLIGPTASGKSALAMRLARTHGNVEIISVDSAQVYCDMDIGTAKPTPAERAAVPHHLIDVMPPTAQWSVVQYADAFNRALADVTARGKTPLAVGGTMMYVSALLTGLSQVPTAQLSVREAIAAQAAREGWPALHAELARVDPITAQRLPTTDAQRISRALEVFRDTGQSLSSFHGARTPLLQTHTPQLIVIEPADRQTLHARIGQRFDEMLRDGVVDEVLQLRARYPALTANHPSMRTVGYRQVWSYLEGQLSADQLREQGIAATRQLAKRQLTWQRHQFDAFCKAIVTDPDDESAVASIVADYFGAD
jgi:tRNA dimethylallyltransferase